VLAAAGRATRVPAGAIHTFWLCHDDNLSNPRGRRPLCFPLSLLERQLGPAAWADTGARMSALAQAVRER
jgi:hypothetical protein